MNETVRLETRIGADEAAAGGVLTIDLAALAENYRILCQTAAPTRVAAVVKADAYGLGAARVVPVLHEAGCRDFFVAHLIEARRLAAIRPRDSRLYVLNGLLPGGETVCANIGAIPVLNSLDQVQRWSALAIARAVTLEAVLQVDTGMARLGLSLAELQALAADPAALSGIRLTMIMSHLACADQPGHEASPTQLSVMQAASAFFPGLPVSFANSAGVFLGPDYRGALARPGIALYGGAPTVAGHPMRPVVRLDVRVIQTRTVPAGTAVGYGGTHVTTGETRIATLAAGYADGLPRSLSNRGAAWFDGVRLPILGRVSMDSLMVDVTALPAALPPGALVELIGPSQTLDAIASDAGTISYEILTALGQRYHRHYAFPASRASGQGQS
ncbi:alanine racemase [Kaistia sp. MMO-174]|uniref:alanine racemase n=1 Tax=Kaistia sp. MMO-174 TaxID=3081256 RepID=UPI00301921CF